ncbi:MAG TPA: AbrB/MazE/SpoVT family DNA-binding domain-containing protein [Thermoplasmata archaeon]|nr:AbrB/MazE/SpoVT family DNA-binding domain-containing protein [Thermoplasmata archaeon]
MPRVHAKVRRWGSSMGIVVPSEIAKELKLKAGDEVVFEIEQAGIDEAFGSLKDWAVDPQKLKDELRRGW